MGWIVYDKTGEIKRCTIKELEYNGSFMGERTISCSFESPVVINFAIGDYLTYRGEVFYLYYIPSQTKSASSGSAQDAFEYDLVFNTVDVELQNCQLLDYVPYGNDYHYQPSPSFSFVGTVKTFAERIQANMNRDYPGWTIDVYEGVETEEAEIQIDNTSCWNALVMINKEFGLNFLVTKRRVRIGYPEDSLNHTFYYGKDNGLYQITRDVNADEAIVTRLYAYGGERNIPSDYNKRESDFSGKRNLMLPGYLETGKSYIESKNISAYGVREYTQLFEDIYPSIAGVELPGIGRIDELVSAEKITEETETSGSFKVTIKNIGFNIKDYLTSETATISIRSGNLTGYEFEIVEVIQLENGNYEITLNKSTRDNFQVPNAGQNLSTGDRFILLNITMPDKYVKYAEDKLLNAATSYLAEHDHVTYTYDIGVDEIYMARNGNLHDLIREGMRLPLYDADFGTDYSIIVQSLSIKEGGAIPVYEISLSDKPIASTIDKIWDAIDNVRNEGAVSKGGYVIGGGLSPEELNKKYLRKDVNDTAHGEIIFDKKIGSSIFLDGMDGKGWEIKADGSGIMEALKVRSDIYAGNKIGSISFAPGFTGWGTEIDIPTATGTFDNIFVRKTFTAYEIVYSQIYGLGGNQIVSDINKIGRVERLSDRWRCYMDDMDGLMLMNLREGDGVRIQRRNGITSTKYLFGRCIGISSDYFDVAYPLIEGTGEPEAGDFAMRWGNDRDTTRQGLIYLTSADQGAPFIAVYDGITGVSTQDTLKAQLGNLSMIRTKNGTQLKGYGAYLNGIYIENSSIYLDNGMTVEQQFYVMNGELRSEIEGVRNDMSLESGNILVNSTFGKDTNYWAEANDIHFINVSGNLLWVGGSFYSDKRKVSDIYRDGNRNVLRIKDTYIFQRNDVMKVPELEESDEGHTFSFSLFYKVMRRGVLTVGFAGQELYDSLTLDPSDEYVKLSKAGKWDGTGDFRIGFTGEILIYGVSLFNDRLADAVIKLETRILQTEEYIKLLATKEYVDSETGAIYTKYDAELSVMAEEISARVTEEQFATAQEAITLANNAAKAAQTAADNANQSVTSLNTYVDGAFADGIITEAEAKAIEKYLNTVNTSKDSVTATYTKLYSNTYLDGEAKTGLKSAKDVLDSSISALISSINTAIADGKTTASEKADVDKKFAAFNTAMSSFESAVETANKYIQDKLKDYTDTATNQVKVKLESDLSVQAGQITGISTRVDNIRNEIDTAGWINTTQGNTLFAAKSLENGDNIISYINQTATTTTIKAERINLVGAVTFSMFNTDLQSAINGKANSSALGDLAYEDYITKGMMSTALQSELSGKANSSSLKALAYLDKVEQAQLGATIISGGHIITSLIDTDAIYANMASIGGFTIEDGGLFSNKYTTGYSSGKFFLHSGGDDGFLGFSATGLWSGIGLNTLPGTLGGIRSLARFENTISTQDVKYGIYVRVQNGGRNIAVSAIGDMLVKGAVYDAHLVTWGPSSTSNTLPVNRGTRLEIYTSSYTTIYLPTRSEIASSLGISSTDYFSIVLYIWNRWSTVKPTVFKPSGMYLFNAAGESVNSFNLDQNKMFRVVVVGTDAYHAFVSWG